MARWVGAQGQVNMATKAQKHAPLLRHLQRTPNPKRKNIFNLNQKTA